MLFRITRFLTKRQIISNCFHIICRKSREIWRSLMLMVGINTSQICPELNANETQVLYDKYHKVSSLKKSPKQSHTILSNMKLNMKISNGPAKYEELPFNPGHKCLKCHKSDWSS